MTLRCVCPSLCACVCVGGFVLISDISVYLCVQLKRVIRSDGFVCVCETCAEDVGGSPAVRPALSAALSSCTLRTNVHISTAELSFSCRP